MPIFVSMVPLSNICKNTDVQKNNMLIAKNLNNIILIVLALISMWINTASKQILNFRLYQLLDYTSHTSNS